METFSVLLAICAGNSPVPGEFPVQRPVTRSFDVFRDLRLNKRLSKQSWGRWLEAPQRPLWRHSNALQDIQRIIVTSHERHLPVQQHIQCNKVTSNINITGPLWGESTAVSDGFPSQRASNTDSVFMSGRHPGFVIPDMYSERTK